MAKPKRSALRDKRPEGKFVALPHIVLHSAQWAELSADAVKALLDVLSKYDLKNNGDLSAHWTLMHARGWRSKDRVVTALRELEVGGWLVRTRQGGSHRPTLWGCTIYALDPLPKLEISGDEWNRTHRGLWARTAPSARTSRRRAIRKDADDFAPVAGPKRGTLSAPVAGPKLPVSDRPPDRTSTPEAHFGPAAGPIKAVLPKVRSGGRSPSKKLPSMGAAQDPRPLPAAAPATARPTAPANDKTASIARKLADLADKEVKPKRRLRLICRNTQ